MTEDVHHATILVVDHNPNALSVKRRLLSRQGYHVFEAENGADALATAMTEHPDLILLDISLPDISGYEVCHQIKTNPRTQCLKVLQTSTDHVSAPDRVKSLEVGADAYLIEPTEEAELLGTLRALLTLAQHERDNRRLIEKLSRTERQLRDATDAAECGLWDWNILSGKLEWFGAHERLAGMVPGGFSGRIDAFSDVLHPDDRTRVWHKVQNLMDARAEHFSDEYRFVHPDGSVHWMMARGRFFYDEASRAVRMTGVVQDITIRKETEDKLAQYRTIFSAATDGIAIIDRQGKYIEQNHAYRVMLGYSDEELIGQLPLMHGEEKAFHEVTKELFDTGRFYGEVRSRRKDGQWIDVALSAFRISDEKGQVLCYVGMKRDITERKQAEQAQAKYIRMLDSGFDAIVVRDAQDRITGWNRGARELYGWTREEAIGQVTHELFHTTFPKPLIEILLDVHRHDRWEGELLHTRKDGAAITVFSRWTLERDEEGQPASILETNMDVTERRQAEKALEEAKNRLQAWNAELEQAVKEKTAELQQSHDRLRVMATELNLSEQQERKRLAAELHDHLQQMLVLGKITIEQGKQAAAGVSAYEQALKKVDAILSDALSYSRTLVADLSPPVLRDHGLATALQWLGTYMQKYKQVVTVIVPNDRAFKLPEDQVILLFQSVRELLINSSKHAGTSKATVRMEARDGQLQITVQDDGKGFDLAAAGTPNGGISSKFGLFSIQERMKALGGSFEIRSLPREGTTATLTLSLIKSEERAVDSKGQESKTSSHSSSSDHSPRSASIRVLLADDHAMMRQGLRSVLNVYNDLQVVGEAQDGVEAVRLVGEMRPQVVVMDINMPKMNGIDATTQIKFRYPETIIIGLSVNASGENQEAMERAGAVHLMTKEAAVEQLYDAIQAAITQTAS